MRAKYASEALFWWNEYHTNVLLQCEASLHHFTTSSHDFFKFHVFFIFTSLSSFFNKKKQNFQSVRTFHKIKLVHIIQEEKYLLDMQVNSRICRVQSFARSVLFSCDRCLRARFFENEWIFKAYNCTMLYMFDQVFHMWHLMYINNSNVERSSFIMRSYVKFMKNSWSWAFARCWENTRGGPRKLGDTRDTGDTDELRGAPAIFI